MYPSLLIGKVHSQFKGRWVYSFIFILFSIEIPVSKQWRPWPDAVTLIASDLGLQCVPRSHLSRLTTKPTKWHVRPAKTQISLSIWRKLGSLATHWAYSDDSDQTRRMPRLTWVFAGRSCHFVSFVMRQLIYGIQGMNGLCSWKAGNSDIRLTVLCQTIWATSPENLSLGLATK